MKNLYDRSHLYTVSRNVNALGRFNRQAHNLTSGSWLSCFFFFRIHHPWTGSYVWPGSCTVKSLLISSCQIFQAAFIFKKWASQQVLHGLLWGPAITGCICCISIAPFYTQVGFAVAHDTRAESVEGLLVDNGGGRISSGCSPERCPERCPVSSPATWTLLPWGHFLVEHALFTFGKTAYG